MASRTTKDHGEIRRWAEERGGKPAHVKSTGSSEDIGILRIDFPGYSGEGSLEPITWDQFFEKFDDRGLALLYQEETAGGERSNFNKIVSSETAEEAETASQRSVPGKSSATKKSSTTRSKKTSAKKAAPKKAAKKKSTVKRPVKKASKTSVAKKSAAQRRGSARPSAKKAIKKSSAKKAAAKKKTSKKIAAKKSASKRRR